jgi:Matrixin
MARAFATNLGLVLLFCGISAWGTCVYETSAWPTPSTTMSVASSIGADFTSAFQQAAQTWDSDTAFAFTVFADAKADPCSNPNDSPPENSVNFGASDCGIAWGTGTLAVTTIWYIPTTGTTVQAGTQFNANVPWGVYSGPWQANLADFRRTAVHELGHVIGLDHDNAWHSIMHTTVYPGDTTESPTAHDISCADARYGAPAPPVPDIEANGTYGSLTLRTNDLLSVTAKLDALGHSGEPADWWVVADTPFGWYYYQYETNSWTLAGPSYTDLSHPYQGPLFNLGPYEVLRFAGLPEGTYVIYFGVDTIMNGSLDLDHLYYDYVVVNIIP